MKQVVQFYKWFSPAFSVLKITGELLEHWEGE